MRSRSRGSPKYCRSSASSNCRARPRESLAPSTIGTPVPVIDLSELTLGRTARAQLSTRIVLVHYPNGRGGIHLLGLIAEDATELIRRTPAEFVPSGVSNSAAPSLGPVAPVSGGLVQLVEVERLLPAALRDMLFAENQAT